MNETEHKVVFIACSIFKSELEEIKKKSALNISVRYVPSMLHMSPEGLNLRLKSLLQEELARSKKVVLLFGDCHPYMHEQESLPGVCRVEGMNCPEILLGHTRYSSMRMEGSFFLMAEWSKRWREVFKEGLGLKGKTAKDFMKDMHDKLVYLDTGLLPVPMRELEEMSDYSGLPYEIMSVSLEPLLAEIRRCMERILKDDIHTSD